MNISNSNSLNTTPEDIINQFFENTFHDLLDEFDIQNDNPYLERATRSNRSNQSNQSNRSNQSNQSNQSTHESFASHFDRSRYVDPDDVQPSSENQSTTNNSNNNNNNHVNEPRMSPNMIMSTQLNTMICEYNRNIRDYQRNMRDFISIIRMQSISEPAHSPIVQPTSNTGRPSGDRLNVDESRGSSATSRPVNIEIPPVQEGGQRRLNPYRRRTTTNLEQENSADGIRRNSSAYPSQNTMSTLLSYIIYPITTSSPSPLINNRVSQQQIRLATTSTIYSSALGDDLICPISMDAIGDGDSVIQIRECGHRFKTEPLLNWFTRNSHCPVCRYDILDYRESFTGVTDSRSETSHSATSRPVESDQAEVPGSEPVLEPSLEPVSEPSPEPGPEPVLEPVLEPDVEPGAGSRTWLRTRPRTRPRI